MVRYEVPPSSTVITRDTVQNIPVHCVISRHENSDQDIKPESRTAEPQWGSGMFDVAILLYRNNRFQDPIAVFPAPVLIGGLIVHCKGKKVNCRLV